MDEEHELPEIDVDEPTVRLMACAYPHGIPHAHYMTLLSILYEYASIRALASAIAQLRGGHYTVYMNDVLGVDSFKPDPRVVSTVMEKLIRCGFNEWKDNA